jgi:transposase
VRNGGTLHLDHEVVQYAGFNPAVRGFYQRLINAGKLHKVALVASMHKLLTILNAMARDGRRWQPAKITS